MKEIYIYVLIDPLTKHIRYIGKTNNLNKRFNHHITNSKHRKYHSALWIKSLVDKNLKPQEVLNGNII
ncbi:MAG: hypothetical protein RLZZ546_2001 [Bacteroidota bacterium]|jgi:predicted GIY-YIG superfamily endonuclease